MAYANTFKGVALYIFDRWQFHHNMGYAIRSDEDERRRFHRKEVYEEILFQITGLAIYADNIDRVKEVIDAM